MGRCVLRAEVMGSKQIVKVLWGANGDCQCLMLLSFQSHSCERLQARYQLRPLQIGVDPQMIIDAQVAFDDRVPASFHLTNCELRFA